MYPDLKLYEKHNGTNPVEYGFGPEWVAMAMYMDDYPRFYTEDMAVLYWFRTIKEKDVLDWYHNDYKKYMEEQNAKDNSAELCDQLDEPSGDSGVKANGPGTETKRKARKRKGKKGGEENPDLGN